MPLPFVKRKGKIVLVEVVNQISKFVKKGKRKEKTSSLGKAITIEQADAFRKYYSFPATTGVFSIGK